MSLCGIEPNSCSQAELLQIYGPVLFIGGIALIMLGIIIGYGFRVIKGKHE